MAGETTVENLEFSIEGELTSFTPIYYPNSLRTKTGKELQRTGASCNGEKVSIKKMKNSEIHVSGICSRDDLSDIDTIIHASTPAVALGTIFEKGGMEVIVKSAEKGEHAGWDAFTQQHLFNYTIDLVSTGRDEYESETPSRLSDV